MAERCSHVQCGAPATARVAFDALACFVWIDPFEADGPRDVGARGAGALCTRHADRLVPPRGWAVQDRRSREPRLWSDRPVAADPAAPGRPARSMQPATAAAATVLTVDAPLPFEATPVATTPVATTPATPAPAPSVSPDDAARDRRRDDIEALLAAPTSPLLSRAFDRARSHLD